MPTRNLQENQPPPDAAVNTNYLDGFSQTLQKQSGLLNNYYNFFQQRRIMPAQEFIRYNMLSVWHVGSTDCFFLESNTQQHRA